MGRTRIRSRRAAEAEIDAPRMQRLESPKLLRDHERRVIRQHHPARPDANRRRSRRHVLYHHGGGRARDARHVVVLGDPVPPVSVAFGVPREIERISERLRRIPALDDGAQV